MRELVLLDEPIKSSHQSVAITARKANRHCNVQAAIMGPTLAAFHPVLARVFIVDGTSPFTIIARLRLQLIECCAATGTRATIQRSIICGCAAVFEGTDCSVCLSVCQSRDSGLEGPKSSQDDGCVDKIVGTVYFLRTSKKSDQRLLRRYSYQNTAELLKGVDLCPQSKVEKQRFEKWLPSLQIHGPSMDSVWTKKSSVVISRPLSTLTFTRGPE